MAAESSPRQNSAGHVSAPGVRSAPVGSSGPSEVLLPGERVISELEPGGGGYFQLTHARVIYNGGGGTDGATAYASVRLKDISSIQISRRPRARRSAAWGVVGLFSAIGVWQVTPDSTIGIGAAVTVALISLFLMADYLELQSIQLLTAIISSTSIIHTKRMMYFGTRFLESLNQTIS